MNFRMNEWYSSLAYLPPALYVSEKFTQETPFYFNLKFSVEKLKKLRKQDISLKYVLVLVLRF